MKIKNFKVRRVLVLIATLFLYSGLHGVLSNSIGVLFAGILQDMPFRAGDLSIYYTIRYIVQALTMSFTVKRALAPGGNRYVALYGLLASLSLAAMAFYQYLWQWYVSAVVVGFALGCILTIVPVVINNWFEKNTGLLIGITLSGAGIFGMFFNPLMTYLVEGFGWRRAALVVGMIQAVIVCIPSLLFYSPSPEAAEPAEQKEAAPAEAIAAPEPKARKKEPRWVYLACFFAVLTYLIQFNFSFMLGTYALSVGYSLAVGGTIASLSMIGNIGGKFLLGYLSDRFGIFRAMQTLICCGLFSMVCFLFAENSVVLIYAAGLTFGLLNSLMTTAPAPLLVEIYGKERYVKKLESMQSVNVFISAFVASMVAYVHDFTGSFRVVFIGFIAMGIMAFGLVVLLKSKGKQAMAE